MPKEKKRARIALRAPLRLRKVIKEWADREQTTMSDIIVRVLSETLLSPSLVRNDQVNPVDMIEQLLARLPDDFGCRTRTTV